MFIYMFRNPLYSGQHRKMVLSFPIMREMREALLKDGWIEIDFWDSIPN